MQFVAFFVIEDPLTLVSLPELYSYKVAVIVMLLATELVAPLMDATALLDEVRSTEMVILDTALGVETESPDKA